MIASLFRSILLVFGALRHARHPLLLPPGRVRMTVAVPAHNEVSCIEATLRAIDTAARRADVAKIVVIDDGSADGTAELLASIEGIDALHVEILPENRGKVHALSRALQLAEGDILVTIDADTRPDPDSLAQIAAPFADGRVSAVAGNVKVANRSGLLGRFQSIEYIGALNIDRRGTDTLDCVSTVPGAFGAWRISALRAIGGFSEDTLSEDTDATLQLALQGHRIAYNASAIAQTEAPASWSGLFRQRMRWQHGNIQCLFKHARSARSAPAIWRYFGGLDFAYKHLLVFFVFPLSLLWLPRALSLVPLPALLGISAVLFGLDLAMIGLAYRLDRERPGELLHAPVQRALFPMFLWLVFATITARWLFRREVRWSRAGRAAERSEHRDERACEPPRRIDPGEQLAPTREQRRRREEGAGHSVAHELK